MRRPWRGHREEELDEEIRAHLRMAVRDRVERGETPEQAEAAVLREFGNVGLVKEVTREMWGWRWLRQLVKDLGFGLRLLRRSPAFSAVAVLTIAVGIGANTAIFSVVNAVLLRPLPFREPERVVLVWLKGAEAAGGDRVPLSVADFLDWRAQTHSFEHVASFSPGDFSYTSGETPEQVRGADTSADFFNVLGAQAELGRTFLPEEEKPGAARVVVVSHDFWRRRLGADPLAVGREIVLDARPYTVVGVMPARFDFPQEDVELWAAYQIQPPTRRGPYWLQGIARVREGVTVEQARAELNALPDPGRSNQSPQQGERFTVLPVGDYLVGDVRPALLVLLGAVGLVLLIAAANVANLMLARAASREKEISIRTALGAGRARILRQLLTESLLVASIGGATGLLLAYWGVQLLLALNPGQIHGLKEATLDGRVLACATVVTLLSGIVFGLAPALQTSRPELNGILKEGGRGSTESRGRRRVRGALVVAEMALALMLLAGAGLLVRSFLSLRGVDPGVNPARVVTMQVSLPWSRYKELPQRLSFYQQLLERVETVPGVESVALTNSLPPDMQTVSDNFSVEGQPPRPDNELSTGDLLLVTPDYFRVMGVPVIRGRAFTDGDREGSPLVCLINQTLAREFFPGQDPVGKHLKTGGTDRPQNPVMEIVGVVGDVKYEGLHAKVQPAYYMPFAQNAWGDMSLVVRSTTPDPLGLVPSISKEVWALDRDLPVARVRTVDELLSRSVAQPRFRTLLLTAFSVMALLLASVGIYGVMSYTVARRTHEIGIRVALGAQLGDVLRLVVGQGMRLAVAGIVLGVAGALALARLMSGLLYGVTATDPLTFAGVALLLALVALVACLVPALRATRVDPTVALRYE
ncbi:MAG TPA: ABC transporter permease [Pyrinomonadaceae bacterium]|nr:ABC transporter permease [Pyrinomonadaceae bacterium]